VQLKTDFVANASHELRTPIAAIRGAVETLGIAADDRAMSDRLRRMIADHVARLEAMISDLLDLSRLESPELRVRAEPADAHALCAQMRELFAPALDARTLRLEADLAPELAHLVCDPTLLELILRNLVENACKFAREGTAVRIVGRAAEVTPAPDTPWQPSADAAGRAGLRLQVIDEGQGIPLRDQARIFERFYQVDPSRDGSKQRRGTGLGLAIVKHAVRRMGGRVGVQSVWQQGTTMTVELPACVALPAEITGG
jgi:two-component system phosphate regulon sensor histidine kinase PhoR